MPERVRVRRVHAHAGHAGVVRVAVAVAAEERAARPLLEHEALVADPAAPEVDVAVLEAEHRDHAFAVDEDVVARQRRVLPVGAAAIERALELARHLALDDLDVADVGLDALRRAEASI